jgi:hypothetical protein
LPLMTSRPVAGSAGSATCGARVDVVVPGAEDIRRGPATTRGSSSFRVTRTPAPTATATTTAAAMIAAARFTDAVAVARSRMPVECVFAVAARTFEPVVDGRIVAHLQ